MANDLPGHGRPGYLVIGLDGQGGPTGLQVTDKCSTTLPLWGMRG